MSADVDLVAAYEAGAVSCHAPPVRDCCARAGIAGVLRQLADQIEQQGELYAGGVVDGHWMAANNLRKQAQRLAERATPAPTPAPEAERAPAINVAGARIITAALAWRTWSDGGLHQRERDLAAAVDTYRAESGTTEGWGAMVRHGVSACTCGRIDLTSGLGVMPVVHQQLGGRDPDCPVHGTQTRRCVCVETTSHLDLAAGRRAWTPGCDQHSGLDTSAIYDGHYEQES